MSAPGHATLIQTRLFSLRGVLPGGWSSAAVWDIARGSDGAMWFSTTATCNDTTCSAVGRITFAGHARLFVVPHHASIASLTSGRHGTIWFAAVNADGLSSYVGRLLPRGRMKVVGTLPSPLINELSQAPGGDLWIGDQANVFRITPRGSVATFPLPAPYTAFDPVAGPDGDIWFTSDLALDGSHRDAIGRLSPSGQLRFFTIPTLNSAPQDIAVGPDRNLWFGEGAGRIGRITTAGTIREFATGYRGSAISAIFAGPARCMWFMDRGRRAVGQITMAGRVREFPLPAPRSHTDLFSLARGPGGSLWFTISSRLAIGRLIVG